MIALQAVEQFAMYTGVRPDDALIVEAAEFAGRVEGLRAPMGALFISTFTQFDARR